MKRIKWLGARWPVPLRALSNRMKARPFTEESLDGFLLERVRDEFIQGRFIERFSYEEINADPFGREEIVERTAYRQTEFTLYSVFPEVQIINGQRSTRDFVNALLEVCKFDLVVEPISVNLLQWVDVLQKLMEGRATIDSIQISGLEIEAGITGKVLLRGDTDVREAFDRMVKNKKFDLEKIQAKFENDSKGINIHLASNGCAKLAAEVPGNVVQILRAALTNLNSSRKS